MGNVHSLSSEAVLGGIVIIGGVVYYSYIHSPPAYPQPNKSTSSNANKKGKKKNSKKSTSVEADPLLKGKTNVDPIVVAFPTILPGQFDADSIASDAQPAPQSKQKSKKKKGKGKDKPTTADASSAESSTPVPPSKPKQKRSSPADPSTSAKSTLKSPPSIDTGTDGSWTRVESHNRKAKQATGGELQPSLSVTTETETGESSPVAEKTTDEDRVEGVRAGWANENRRTLAEKILPKPRKTAVDECVQLTLHSFINRG